MSTPSRVRLRYFLRSLLPADLGQLSFLVGIVCLIFAARMSWWPRHDGVALSSLGPLDNAASRISTYGLSVVGGWSLILSSFGGYFVCFWPGFRPVRRLLLVILLPAIAGMASFFARFTYLGQSYSSALDANWLASLFRPGQLSSWVASFGFHVAFIGLLLIGIFTVRVIRGVSCLPLITPFRIRPASSRPGALEAGAISDLVATGSPVLAGIASRSGSGRSR